MAARIGLTRKQVRFLQSLVLGSSIVDAAKEAGIGESTAHRWLKDPLVKAERARLEGEIQQAEQAEIERILTTGYAAVHNRIEALSEMATLIKLSFLANPDTDPKKIRFEWVTPDKIREFRGCMDDIAKELGQRVKKQEIEHSGLKDLLDSEHAALLAELAALPDDAAQSEKPDRGTGENPASTRS